MSHFSFFHIDFPVLRNPPIGIRRVKERLKEALRNYGGQGATHHIPAVDQTTVVRAIGEFQNQRESFGDYCPLQAAWP